MGFEDEWRAWHDSRERYAGAEYGPAALESTNWLITCLLYTSDAADE